MIELQARDLYWHYDEEPARDLCAHGAVYLNLAGHLVSDGTDSDWTVSTAAFNLLKTVRTDHAPTQLRKLIPHCGFTMWAIEGEPDGLFIGGCDIGIDWEIKHLDETVIHKIDDRNVIETQLDDWREAVCNFSDEVHAFFMTSWPKIIDDYDDQRGFELFMKIWEQRRKEV